VAGLLTPHLDQARFATSWQERERGLVEAVVALAKRHNELKLTRWLDPAPHPFHDRPFTISGGARFSAALLETIRDPVVRALPPNIGGMDQISTRLMRWSMGPCIVQSGNGSVIVIPDVTGTFAETVDKSWQRPNQC
jgi:hypothetical protein